MKKILSLIVLLVSIIAIPAGAQILKPVKFSISQKRISPTEIEITFKGRMEAGWHVYSTGLGNDGPTSATFTVDQATGAAPQGTLKAGSGEKHKQDPIFDMPVRYFEGTCTFTQRIKLTAKNYQLKGYLTYGACNDENCLPPTNVDVSLKGSDGPDAAATPAETQQTAAVAAAAGVTTADSAALTATAAPADSAAALPQATLDSAEVKALWSPVTTQLSAFDGAQSGTQGKAWWYIFILGFAGGLIALFTPCVWPIIPMTVSFFLKRSSNRSRGIRDAITYGISIIVIYVALGLIITSIFGASALNDLSTNAIFNIFFFLMLVVFAASFFGGFEITLPSKWNNAVNHKADTTTGLISIFLMAFTLSLVSFSCTGPIIGFLLVEVSTQGSILAPTIGMFGFAVALALPFTLFALFPTWLKSAPKDAAAG